MNTIHVVEPTDEPQPPVNSLTASTSSFSAFFQRLVYGVVFGIHDAKKSGVSEALRTPAAVKWRIPLL